MLSTPGIGSGLDINGIITQLMIIERQPLARLGVQQVEAEAQVSAFGKLKSSVSLLRSAMTELSDPAKFRYFKATTGNDEVLTGSADADAAKGSYSLEVVRIAENHRLAGSTFFADTDTTLIGGAGETLTITVGSTSFVVASGNKTLAGIRDAINGASANPGVTASILHDDSGYRLTLSADDTGSTHAISVAYSAADPFALQSLNADRDGSGGFTAADLDAVMVVENSFTVTRSGNAVDDVIDGITLNLAGAGTTTLKVARDDAKIGGSVQQFIGVYNDVVKTIAEMRGSVLKSERGALLSLEAQFRAILNSGADGSTQFSFLSELGVTTGLDGRLSLNNTVFNAALTSDADGVAALFTDPDSGWAARFGSLAGSLLDAGGMLDNREQSLKARIDDLKDARRNLEFRLTQREAALLKQYSALDTLVAQLNTTSSYLSTQLEQLAANTRSSKRG